MILLLWNIFSFALIVLLNASERIDWKRIDWKRIDWNCIDWKRID